MRDCTGAGCFPDFRKSGAEIVVRKQKPAEIFIEELDARSVRDEIVIGRQIGEMIFTEGFIEGDLMIESGIAPTRVDIDRKIFLHIRIVHIENGRHADFPFARLEIGFALEQFQRDFESSVDRINWSGCPKNAKLPGRCVLTPAGVGVE